MKQDINLYLIKFQFKKKLRVRCFNNLCLKKIQSHNLRLVIKLCSI